LYANSYETLSVLDKVFFSFIFVVEIGNDFSLFHGVNQPVDVDDVGLLTPRADILYFLRLVDLVGVYCHQERSLPIFKHILKTVKVVSHGGEDELVNFRRNQSECHRHFLESSHGDFAGHRV